jgi:hypothetical protein
MTNSTVIKKVETDLKSELALLGDCSVQVSLGPYRTAFDKLMKEFKTIRPLLVNIKDAYDKALHESQTVAAEVGPLRSLVATVAEDCERKILQIQQTEREDMNALKEENTELKKQIQFQNMENTDLQVQIKKLGEEVGTQYKKYRDEKCARRLLISDMNDQKMLSQQPTGETDESVDPIHMKLALEQCRKDLTEAQQTITRMQMEYSEVVPKRAHETLSEKYEKSEDERQQVTKNLSIIESEFKILKDTYNQVSTERDEAVKVKDDLGRSGTPRPEWDEVATQLDCDSYSSTDLSSRDKVTNIISDLKEAKSAGGPDYLSTSPPDPKPSTWPDFLQSKNTEVRNRKLSPEETAKLIKELWKAKLAEKERKSWALFLPAELQNRFNEASDEFLFSLFHSLQSKKQVYPHFQKFLEYMCGERNEEEYTRIVSQSSDLLRLLQDYDPAHSGVVSAEQFSTSLSKAFPLKMTESIEELKNKFGSDSVKYSELFDEDETGSPSGLIKLLQEQDLKEKEDYLKLIKIQLEGSDSISTAEAKIAFMSVDPGINVQIINTYLQFGLAGAESLPLSKFMSNISNAPVYRVSPIQPSL